MSFTIQADESGSLVLPNGIIGQVEPGTRFSVEPHGDSVILRREPGKVPRTEPDEAAAAKIARLRKWIASFTPGPAISLEGTRRDTMYD